MTDPSLTRHQPGIELDRSPTKFRCPLWVISRTCRHVRLMSALLPITDTTKRPSPKFCRSGLRPLRHQIGGWQGADAVIRGLAHARAVGVLSKKSPSCVGPANPLI